MENIDITVTDVPQKERTFKNFIKAFLFYFVQFTWGLPVNLVGGLVFLIVAVCKKRKWQRFGYGYIAYLPWKGGGLSLGIFIFMKANHPNPEWTYNTRIHEYGHTWQCLLLGPLYYLVVALPSVVWCNLMANYRKKNNISYYKLYCEKWANVFGEKFTGLKRKNDD